jgi:dolichol-phosphate mannosyltransferase
VYLRAVLAMYASDFTSGYRAYSRRVMEALLKQPIRGRGHSVLPELLFRAKRLGFRIGEIPIRFRRRHLGKSKVGFKAIGESLLVPWRVRFACRREPQGGDSQ